jgi:propanediol utilization protein
MAFKKDTKRDLEMENPRLPRPRHTHTQKKNVTMLFGPTHTQTQRKSRLPKGETNIKEGVETKRERTTNKESSK